MGSKWSVLIGSKLDGQPLESSTSSSEMWSKEIKWSFGFESWLLCRLMHSSWMRGEVIQPFSFGEALRQPTIPSSTFLVARERIIAAPSLMLAFLALMLSQMFGELFEFPDFINSKFGWRLTNSFFELLAQFCRTHGWLPEVNILYNVKEHFTKQRIKYVSDIWKKRNREDRWVCR